MAKILAPTIWHHIAIRDRGTVPVTIVRDHGHELQVADRPTGRGRVDAAFWVKREDFVPAPPVVP
jgi:hypothetical protein